MLLAGHKISIVDVEDDGESVYEIGLQDFLNVASTKRGYQLLGDVLSGDGDYYTADAFLQRVVFGEEVYG